MKPRPCTRVKRARMRAPANIAPRARRANVPRRAEAGGRGRSESVWILVVGAPQVIERPEGGAAVLRDLGCRVQMADLWDRIDAPPGDPPTAVLVEALDQVDAGRASW